MVIVVTALGAATFTAIRALRSHSSGAAPQGRFTVAFVTDDQVQRTRKDHSGDAHQISVYPWIQPPSNGKDKSKGTDDPKASDHSDGGDHGDAEGGHGSDGGDHSDAEGGHGDDGDHGDAEGGHDNHGDDEDDDHEGCKLESGSSFVNSLSQALDDKKLHEGDDDHDNDDDCSPPATTIPEPASLALFGSGMLVLAGAGYWRRRRND